MTETNIKATTTDSLRSAVRIMRDNSLSSLFVVDEQNKVAGMITVDDAIKGVKQDKDITDILKHNFEIVRNDEYVNDLIVKSLETKYPLVVVDEDDVFAGIILRVHLLSGLVPDDINGND